MFLYVRLMMEMVAHLVDWSEIEKELQVLPESLDAAYHRIMVRIGERDKVMGMAGQAGRLLGWIACTPHLITPREAQQALRVRPGDQKQVFEVPKEYDVIDLLGPIVEVVDGGIRFVHFTAKEYISSPHLGKQLTDTTQATLDLALQCIEYLCQDHHDPSISTPECSHNLATGQYILHVFASHAWFDLVCQYFRLTEEKDPPKTLVNSITKLFKTRKVPGFSTSLEDDTRRENENEGGDGNFEDKNMPQEKVEFRPLKPGSPMLYQPRLRVFKFRKSSSTPAVNTDQDSHEYRSDALSISSLSQRIWKALEVALCSSPTPGCHEACTTILTFYGPRPFRCRVIQCNRWQDRFLNVNARQTHEKTHDKPLKCDVPGCEYGLIGFLSEKMRRDHITRAHQSDSLKLSLESGISEDSVDYNLLSDLIRENQEQLFHELLSMFPNALEIAGNRRKLQSDAARYASATVFQELDEATPRPVMNLLSESWMGFIIQSINGKNKSTMQYFLSRVQSFPSDLTTQTGHEDNLMNEDAKSRGTLVIELVSSDWQEGVEIYTGWLRGCSHLLPEKGPRHTSAKHIFSATRLIRAATRQTWGCKHLLDIWSGIDGSSTLGKDWANMALRNVAQTGHSIPLAAYLLEQGANINDRHSTDARTALQCAAESTELAAAEMMQFLLLHGADPEVNRIGTDIREQKGAMNIHNWLSLTWDELVEKTKKTRANKKRDGSIISEGTRRKVSE
ncbi:hypothetical protein F5Y14DRAFT_396498 [Nemania sp. NC0429]|nr:hypothetical protein F5Y14DRAFT_396498 [Nemania sp. NC0429]